MAVTHTGEVSPHYLAGLVAAARIDKTEDVYSYGVLEAISKAVLAAVSPRGVLLPVHDRKLTDTTTTVAVVYKGRQLLARSAPDPEGEHLFDMQVRVRGRRGDYFLWISGPSDGINDTSGGTHFDFPAYAQLKQAGSPKKPLSRRSSDELFKDAEWIHHLIAAHVKYVAVSRLEA